MPHKELKDIDDFASILVLTGGFWGAFLNYAKRKVDNYPRAKKIGLFVFDTASSSSIAIITYLIVLGYTQNDLLSIGLSGFFAHQGTRSFYMLEQIISQKLGVNFKD